MFPAWIQAPPHRRCIHNWFRGLIVQWWHCPFSIAGLRAGSNYFGPRKMEQVYIWDRFSSRWEMDRQDFVCLLLSIFGIQSLIKWKILSKEYQRWKMEAKNIKECLIKNRSWYSGFHLWPIQKILSILPGGSHSVDAVLWAAFAMFGSPLPLGWMKHPNFLGLRYISGLNWAHPNRIWKDVIPQKHLVGPDSSISSYTAFHVCESEVKRRTLVERSKKSTSNCLTRILKRIL